MSYTRKWLVDRVVPKLVTQEGGTFLGVEVGDKMGGNPTDGGIASLTFRINLRLMMQDLTEKELLLIAKTLPEEPIQRTLQNSLCQYFNEALWYTEVVPAVEELLEGTSLGRGPWPKCYICVNDSPELAAVVMQDLQPDGYVFAPLPASDLDFEHTGFALEKMAILHALGYTLKFRRPEFYSSVVKRLQEPWYCTSSKDSQDGLMLSTVERGIAPLRCRAESADFVTALDTALGNSPFSMQTELVRPRDPNTSVLCHGDLTRNNVLYKYNLNGSISDARFIDFAVLRESSPAVDIATFFYISLSPSVLEGPGLRRLLSQYHSALVSALKQLSGPADPWKGDVNALEIELGRHVLLVYCICSYFLPVMVMQDQQEFSIEKELKKTQDELIKTRLKMGGDKVTQRLTNMLLDWQSRGFHQLWNIKN